MYFILERFVCVEPPHPDNKLNSGKYEWQEVSRHANYHDAHAEGKKIYQDEGIKEGLRITDLIENDVTCVS